MVGGGGGGNLNSRSSSMNPGTHDILLANTSRYFTYGQSDSKAADGPTDTNL